MSIGYLRTFAPIGGLLLLLGCSSSSSGPAPFSIANPDPNAPNELDREELRDLAIDPGETIVDEGDSLFAYDDDGDEIEIPESPGDPVAEDNPVADDDPNADPLALDEPDEETEAEAATAKLGVQTLHPLTEVKAGLGKTYKCRQKTPGRRCVCKGSPLNCQLPNTQRGFRNRYNPPAISDAIGDADGDAKKQKDLQDKLGRWTADPATPLYDGNGLRRSDMIQAQCYAPGFAEVPGVCVHVNFGQLKMMRATDGTASEEFAYVWDVIANGEHASSWIPLAKIQDADLKKMQIARNPKPGKTVRTHYLLKTTSDWPTMPRWTKGKIAKDKVGKKGADVGDYLIQPGKAGSTLNFGYGTPGVGGVSIDTFVVADSSSVPFARARSTASRPTLVRVPIYDGGAKGEAGARSQFYWAYGLMAGRWGWVPLSQLKVDPANNETAPTKDSCAGRSDGFYCSEESPWSGFTCKAHQIALGLQCGSRTQKCTGLVGTEIGCQ